jgi:AcrR family transcriptional regulator
VNVTRGRPRDPEKDTAVLAAVRELLEEDGYQATTIPAVARRAGVGAPTIYRRWPSQAELVETVFDRPPTAVLTGSFEAAVRALVRSVVTHFAEPATRAAVPGLLVEYHREPARYAALVARSEDPLREAFRGAHAAGVAVGAVAPSPSADALFDTVIGTAVYHGVVRDTADDALVDTVVGVVLAAARP